MKQQIADAVAGVVRAPPDLLVTERFGGAAQTRPVLVEQLLAGEIQKQRSELLVRMRVRDRHEPDSLSASLRYSRDTGFEVEPGRRLASAAAWRLSDRDAPARVRHRFHDDLAAPA